VSISRRAWANFPDNRQQELLLVQQGLLQLQLPLAEFVARSAIAERLFKPQPDRPHIPLRLAQPARTFVKEARALLAALA
jgi:hypothetical protein